MLKILGKAASINVRKVLWTCDELGIPFSREDWGTGFQATATPSFLALNPNALVPVLVDDDVVLWESNTICRYLAGRENSALLPQDPYQRALVEQWMDWQAGEFNNSWRYAFMGLVRGSPAHQDRGLIDASIAAWNRHVGIVEEHLANGTPYMTGAHFTLADIVLGVSLARWQLAPIARPDYPAVAAYCARLSERAGYRAWAANRT
ncbi:MAG: glutathione S-transferase N-terminal domain-containing protein [Pseudomonadota bacterium]|nr:glutathione S-transferase N-terminal domain-containing protein [Pseudomonadota bacterium]